MPLFHFNFSDGATYCKDVEGVNFDDCEGAYLAAYDGAADIWRELLKQRADPRVCAFEVTDRDGRVVFELPFAEVLDSCRRPHGANPPFEPTKLRDVIFNAQRARKSCHDLRTQLSATRKALDATKALLARAEQQLPKLQIRD